MDIRGFYENYGVDYDVFLQRMMGKEALIEKYIRIFMEDATYAELEQAIAAHDFEAAAMKAHTLKGVAMNLSLDGLGSSCAEMVKSFRSGNTQELVPQFESVKAEYMCIMKGLGQ